MSDKFSDPHEAVEHFVSAMKNDFPDAVVEVMQFSRNRARTVNCTVDSTAALLERICSRWPRIAVDYTPDAKYGMIGELQCHGETNAEHTTQWMRRGDYERPRVVVVITQVAGEDLLVGGQGRSPIPPESVLHSPTR